MERKANLNKVKDIDEDCKVIRFDPSNLGKITGSRFQAVLGDDTYMTEFAAACLIARIYSEYEKTKYTEAGELIEPVIRKYVGANGYDMLKDALCLSPEDRFGVEEPVPKKECGFDHFKDSPIFGGMVDGYIRVNGKRRAVLEIKTASSREKWTDAQGEITKAPENYILQASLYAELSGLDEIVFAVGFLEDSDYENPEGWKIGDDNFYVIHMKKKDISEEMDIGRRWFEKYIMNGVTPEWTEKDSEIVDCFYVKKLNFVSDDLTDLIKRYADSQDSELEREIEERFISMVPENIKRMEYQQNGIYFVISEAEGENGTADGCASKRFKMTVTKQ